MQPLLLFGVTEEVENDDSNVVVDFYTTSTEYTSDDPIVVVLITNLGQTNVELCLPEYLYGHSPTMIYYVYFNKKQLKPEGSPYIFPYIYTFLKPGESVTVINKLSKVLSQDVSLKEGRYLLRNVALCSGKKKHVFYIRKGNSSVINVSLSKIEDEKQAKKAIQYLSFNISYKEKLKIINLIIQYDNKEIIWECINSLKNTYLLLETLNTLSVKNIDKDLLVELLNNKDITVRRQVIVLLSKFRNDEELVNIIKEKVESENDKIYLMLSKYAIFLINNDIDGIKKWLMLADSGRNIPSINFLKLHKMEIPKKIIDAFEPEKSKKKQ